MNRHVMTLVFADVVQFLSTGSAYFQMWGLQDDKSGSSVVKRKILSIAETEQLQTDLKKVNEDLSRTQVCVPNRVSAAETDSTWY